jgi:ribonuclease HI
VSNRHNNGKIHVIAASVLYLITRAHIQRHSPRCYIGSRNATRHLSSTSPIYAQVKASPTGNKVRPEISRFDEQHKKIDEVLRAITCQITTMINQKANYRMERALWNATSELQFCGDVTIEESPGDAIATVTDISSKSSTDSQHIVIFVDGSLAHKSDDTPDSIAHLGAAVVYKFSEDGQDWQKRQYFTTSNKRDSVLAELFAIAQGLAVATELIMRLRRQNGCEAGGMATNYRVTIFSDCQSALWQVKNLRKKPVAKSQMCSDPIISKIITRSQRLRQVGVHLELRWVPGHSKVEGNVVADRAAYLAAKTPDTNVSIDEGLRLIESETTGNE